MDITLSRTRRSELVTAIADLEARGWTRISGIAREEKESKQFRRDGRYQSYIQHNHTAKYMVRMRREEKMEVAQ